MERTYTNEIYTLYEDYTAWSITFLVENGGMNILRRFFLGNSEYNKQKEHTTFFKAVTEVAENYAAALDAGEGREELLPLLQYVLVDCHTGCDETTDWMLLASEKNFIPLLDYINEEEAAALSEPYMRLRRKNRGLPPQDEIRKKLKKAHK